MIGTEMTVEVYSYLPSEALDIRMRVFVDEQGFTDEVDDTDGFATHFVMRSGGLAVATCRIFEGKEKGEYLLGRLAVIKEYRGQGCGKGMLEAAEQRVRELGGTGLSLHSQLAAKDFYLKCGYAPDAEPDSEQGVAHIWMKKKLC